MRDHVWDSYLSTFTGNRSSFIEEMFIKGCEVASGDMESTKQKLLQSEMQNRNLILELNKLKMEYGSLKQKFSKRPHWSDASQKKLQVLRSIQATGRLGDVN
jgi:hypothetical protein